MCVIVCVCVQGCGCVCVSLCASIVVEVLLSLSHLLPDQKLWPRVSDFVVCVWITSLSLSLFFALQANHFIKKRWVILTVAIRTEASRTAVVVVVATALGDYVFLLLLFFLYPKLPFVDLIELICPPCSCRSYWGIFFFFFRRFFFRLT